MLPRWLSAEESACPKETKKESACQDRRRRFDPSVGKISWGRKWQLTPILLPGESHGQTSLVGYSLRSHKSDGYDRVTRQQVQK